jgi:hypothetical protein
MANGGNKNSIGKVSEPANAKTGDVCIGILQMLAIGRVKLLGWCCRTGVCHRYQGYSEPIAPFTTVTKKLRGYDGCHACGRVKGYGRLVPVWGGGGGGGGGINLTKTQVPGWQSP